MSLNWFNKSFRKVHLIYSAPDWASIMDERWNAKKLVRRLKKAAVDCVEFHTKDHYGIAYYDTKLGKKFHRDLLKEFVEEAHLAGIKTLVYYSVFFDLDVWKRNPSWRCVDIEGRDESKIILDPQQQVAKSVCINSPYRYFVLGQLEEISKNYEIDGFWLDIFRFNPLMPGARIPGQPNYFGACFCKYCQEKFEKTYARKLPTVEPTLREKVALLEFYGRSIVGFLKECILTIKKYKPEALVGINNNASVKEYRIRSHQQGIINLIDYNSIECHGPDFQGQSRVAKFMRGQDKPFEVLTPGISLPGWIYWIAKPLELLKIETAIVTSNGGSLTVGMNLHPNGEENRDQFSNISKLFNWLKEREPFLVETESVSDIAVLWTEDTLFREKSMRGLHAALVENHSQFDIINDMERLRNYELIILPDKIVLNKEAAAKIKKYIKDGGKIIAMGEASLINGNGSLNKNYRLSEVFGINFFQLSPLENCYVSLEGPLSKNIPSLIGFTTNAIENKLTTGKNIASIIYPFDNVSVEKTILWARYLPPMVESPYPMIVENYYGEGRCVYVATCLGENLEDMRIIGHGQKMEDPYPKQLLFNIINEMVPNPLIKTNAPKGVEVVLNKKKEKYIVNLINTYPGMIAGKCDLGKEAVRLQNIHIQANLEKMGEIKNVRVFPSNKQLTYEIEDEWLKIDVPIIGTHIMLLLE